jgi:hypothetical protein
MQNKKQPKDILTHKQFAINRRSDRETTSATNWIRSVGLNEEYFFAIDIKLLQAQKQAHTLLTHQIDLLTSSQIETLRHFQHLMTHKNTRRKLKPSAAYPVLNISTKINRQLFKQHRSLTRTSH